MSKYLGVIFGIIIVLLGLTGAICWRADLLTVLKGFLPVILILAGSIAVIAGLSQIMDELSSRN